MFPVESEPGGKVRKTVDEAKRIAGLVLDAIPKPLVSAKDTVIAAAEMFTKNPDRETALLFADACRRSAKKFRVTEGPVGELRLALAEALIVESVVLEGIAEALHHYDPMTASDEAKQRVASLATEFKGVAVTAERAMTAFSLGLSRAILQRLQADGKITAEDLGKPA